MMPKSKNTLNEAWTINRPLFTAFPDFCKSIYCLDLADLPTPLYHLDRLGKKVLKKAYLYMKDDSDTGKMRNNGKAFGGNKIRKLEFLFADALAHDAQSVLTYGCIGSNHVVATALLAKYLDLKCTALLTPQPVTDVVKRNLLLMGESGCDMILNPDKDVRSMQTICTSVQHKYDYGDIPYFIPTGGSCPVGIVGFVNAAFELKKQIENEEIPKPQVIYVAAGSGGTVAGLLLGLRAAQLDIHLTGVAVEPEIENGSFVSLILKLVEDTNAYLHERNSQFPLFRWKKEDVHIVHDTAGSEYGAVTHEAEEAIRLFENSDAGVLDTTYTGKAAAGMLKDVFKWDKENSVILFWNTFCAKVDPPRASFSYLSKPFHQFFY